MGVVMCLEYLTNSFKLPTNVEELKLLLEASHAELTFWGSRVVTFTSNGRTESVYLDSLAEHIVRVANSRCEADDLTAQERLYGVAVVQKLEGYYKYTDMRVDQANLFTWILNYIGEFSFIPYTSRFYLEETAKERFLGYSEPKFIEAFGPSPWRENIARGRMGPPLRIIATQAAVQELVAKAS